MEMELKLKHQVFKMMKDNLDLVGQNKKLIKDNLDNLEQNKKLIKDNLDYKKIVKDLQDTFKGELEKLKTSYEELLNDDIEKLKQEKVKDIEQLIKDKTTPYTIIMIDPVNDKCILALQNFDIRKYNELVLEINGVKAFSVDLKKNRPS